jgi:hypothetical protein
LVLAGGVVAVLRVLGVRVRFQLVSSIGLTMLPMLVMSALVLLILEGGVVALVVFRALHAAGFDISAKPHRYEVVSLLALAALGLCVSRCPG